MKDKVIVITGPTASGKSSLGIEVAKKLDGVVISADSMQIYKGLDVGTAKVTKLEADGIKHELIDIAEVTEKFSVSDYKKMCYEKIDEVLTKGKVPIIVGGTGLYINAIVNNMSFEEKDLEKLESVKAKLLELTENKTPDELYDILVRLDEKSALNIDKNNTRRVLRAIELSLLGTKKSSLDEKQDLWNKNESKYNFITFFVDMPRDLLYDRINKRVDLMVETGVLDETKMLYEYKNSAITALQAIGYKEFFEFLEGSKSLEECKELLKQKSRNYAKRQITWFKKLKDKVILDGTKSKEEIVQDILKEYYDKR